MLALVVAGSMAAAGAGVAQAQGGCRTARVTGYSAEQYPGRTADGTSTWGAIRAGDWIAAGPAAQLGRRITVYTPNGPARYRVADTGQLSAHGIDYDLLFATTSEAVEWGSRSVTVCLE